jgi:hypothetical protein
MNRKNSMNDAVFVPYDDDNIEHVLAGPDYGQPESSSAWTELDSVEYPDFVKEIEEKIIVFPHLKITKF